MVLTDIQLKAEIEAGRLVFAPELLDFDPKRGGQQIGTCSIDLRLGEVIREYHRPPDIPGIIQETLINTAELEFVGFSPFIDNFTQIVDCSAGYYDLKPGKHVLAWTLERVTLPSHLCARVEGRSRLARLGLTVHNTAPLIQPGWYGNITLELFHNGPIPLRLHVGKDGLRICQLIVEQVNGIPLKLYRGEWQGQAPT